MNTWAALLAIAILAGTASQALADNHNIAPITVETNAQSYEDGDVITISGMIKDLDPDFLCGVTIQVWDPRNNIIRVAQASPVTSGEYEYSFPAGGPNWKVTGDYTISVKCNAIHVDTTVSYTVPEPLTCEAGFEMVDGACVEIVLTCEAGFEMVDGACVEIPPPPVVCGEGTELVDGQCQQVPSGGSCLIATAAYGTEMASQVQYLREIRDNTLMSTSAGTSFMDTFNGLYYSISPPIADMERQNPVFRETVKVVITPMLMSLSLMSLAEDGSEASVLGFGLLVIALNIGMYVAMPALLGFKAYGKIRAMQMRA